MVQRVSVRFIDDLDPHREASHTVAFSLGADHYEIDLNDEHLAELLTVLQPYIAAARGAL